MVEAKQIEMHFCLVTEREELTNGSRRQTSNLEGLRNLLHNRPQVLEKTKRKHQEGNENMGERHPLAI